MINLLPPHVKEGIAFAKRNAVGIGYLKLMLILVSVLTACFVGAGIYLDQRIHATSTSYQQKQDQIASYKKVEDEAKIINERVAAIKSIQDSQPRFTTLLSDIAKAMPKNASLTNLTLTGDDKKPIRVTATADSYATAVALRDSLASSPRISGVDIESVSSTKDGVSASLTISFKPGQAR
jgi:Tfp pilus assembly protein PilN